MEKGTKVVFGKATAKKIKRAKKQGGEAAKQAVFVENMIRIARKHRKR